MFDKSKITLADIRSEYKIGYQYIPEEPAYKDNYEKYQPSQEIIDKIKAWLDEKEQYIVFVAFGATWCGDCKVQLPRLVKIERTLKDKRFEVRVLGGIKVKPPYEREKGKVIWKSPPSPPETLDERFDMFHIPAIFIFDKAGRCLGKIDEKPEHKPTMEEEILYYLERAEE